MFSTPIQQPTGRAGGLYPELPTELRSPAPLYAPSSSFHTPERQRPAPPAPPPVTVTPVVPVPARSVTDNLTPAARAAKVIQDTLEAEKRYPQLDDIVSRKNSLPPLAPISASCHPRRRRLLTLCVQRASLRSMMLRNRMPGSRTSRSTTTPSPMPSLNSTIALQATP